MFTICIEERGKITREITVDGEEVPHLITDKDGNFFVKIGQYASQGTPRYMFHKVDLYHV